MLHFYYIVMKKALDIIEGNGDPGIILYKPMHSWFSLSISFRLFSSKVVIESPRLKTSVTLLSQQYTLFTNTSINIFLNSLSSTLPLFKLLKKFNISASVK